MTVPLSHFCSAREQRPHPFWNGFRPFLWDSLGFLLSDFQVASGVCLSLTLSSRPLPRHVSADAHCRDRGNLSTAHGHFLASFVALAPASTTVDPIVSSPDELDVLGLSGEDGRKTLTHAPCHSRQRFSLFPRPISDFWSVYTRFPRAGFSFLRICELSTSNPPIPAHP
jgi:hypothetical protein